jgi:hypothetical protein
VQEQERRLTMLAFAAADMNTNARSATAQRPSFSNGRMVLFTGPGMHGGGLISGSVSIFIRACYGLKFTDPPEWVFILIGGGAPSVASALPVLKNLTD